MGRKFAILIDSTGELNKEFRTKYDIDYCPMQLAFEGKEYLASLDYDSGYTPHEIYQKEAQGVRVTTSQVTNETYLNKFKKYLDEGKDILYIACSSALSASVNAAKLVAKELEKEYKGAKIICFDSLITGYAQADMALRASKMREEGKSLDEVFAWLDANKLRFNQFATTPTLTYLARAGRVKGSKAFLGNLFGVKPIIISDIKGNNFAYKKVKGRKPSLIEIAKSAVEAAEDIEHQVIYIGHCDDEEAALFVKEEILAMAKPLDIYIGPIGPIVGASCGPGMIATYSFGKEVTILGE
ncbi:MAG: DegV family protein [Bacilli bacterium]|nr:DegV family protein [Bacilli bacterium]MDY6430671.1 DegV family protein [Bacilli bacterium]